MSKMKKQSYEMRRTTKQHIRLRDLRANPEYIGRHRILYAERKRLRLANLSAEERQRLRESETELKRLHRIQQATVMQIANEIITREAEKNMQTVNTSQEIVSVVETDEKRAKAAIRKRQTRAALTPEKREDVRAKDAARKRQFRRSNSTKRKTISTGITEAEAGANAFEVNETKLKLAPKLIVNADVEPDETTIDKPATGRNFKIRFALLRKRQ